MNKSNYNKETIKIFDIIGSFFIDVFYNNHYLLAKDVAREGKLNIVDAYRRNLQEYVNGIKNPKLFNQVIDSLYKYYQNACKDRLTFIDFYSLILQQFIPNDYVSTMKNNEKDRVFKDIINRSVNEFASLCVSHDVLNKIINDHANVSNVILMQDKIIDIYIIIREDFHAKFTDKSMQDKTESVSKKTFDKLKAAYIEEKRISCDLKSELDTAKNIIEQLMNKYNETNKNHEQIVNKLTNKINEMQIDNQRASEQRALMERNYQKNAPEVKENIPLQSPGIIKEIPKEIPKKFVPKYDQTEIDTDNTSDDSTGTESDTDNSEPDIEITAEVDINANKSSIDDDPW